MVNINIVYRTVQALLNKEQRGYVAPTEFNLFAEQAQLEIFEGYFYDKSHFLTSRKGKDGMILENLQEKIDIFTVYSSSENLVLDSGRFTLPTTLYRLDDVYFTDSDGERLIVTKIDHDGSRYILRSKKTRPTEAYPKFERYGNTLQVYPSSIQDNVTIDYVKQPDSPIWGYQSLGADREPLFNPSTTTNFELHPSEQYLLVQKILISAGVQIKQTDIIQYAAGEEVQDNQNKKS